jgi:hypothetical protein
MDGDIMDAITTANGTELTVEEITAIHKKIMGIYIIYNKVNNKCYVGQTINLRKRKKEHRTKLNTNIHDNKYLQRSCDKYGLDSFIFYIVEIVDDVQNLNEQELYYIKLLETRMNAFGYNLKLDTYSREGENVSKSIGIEYPTLRKPIVQVTFDGEFVERYDGIKIAAKNMGVDYSIISNCLRKKTGSACGYVWIYESVYVNETFNFREYVLQLPNNSFTYQYNIFNKFELKNKSQHGRSVNKVYQFSKSGELIKIWNKVSETKNFGFETRFIYACCVGKSKTHKGFIWIYESTYNNETFDFELYKNVLLTRQSKECQKKNNNGIVYQMTVDENVVKIWECAAITKSYGFNPNKIYECCNGQLKTHRGFKWAYLKNRPDLEIRFGIEINKE